MKETNRFKEFISEDYRDFLADAGGLISAPMPAVRYKSF
jgi:hypothetical protein